MCKSNGILIKDLKQVVSVINKNSNDPKRFDLFPVKSIDMCKLSKLTHLNIETLENMTFTTVLRKFFRNINDKKKYTSIIEQNINRVNRKFCPECIKLKMHYKLIWQVREIELCDKHKIKLISKCPSCGTEQPYIHEYLVHGLCVNCLQPLFPHNNTCKYDRSYINNQIRFYRDWYFLLDPTNILVESLMDFEFRQIISMKILEIIKLYEKKQNNICIDKTLSRAYKKRLKGIVKGTDKSNVSINKLLYFLRGFNISIKEFADFKFKLDKEIILNEANIKDTNKIIMAKRCDCTTQWCPTKGRNNRVMEIRNMNSKEFSKISICLDCFIRYRYDGIENVWKTIDSVIQQNALIVMRLLEEKYTHRYIYTKLNISKYSLYKIIGYLMNTKLITTDILKKYYPTKLETNILEKFKILLETKGKKEQNAYKLFGWSKIEYFFYYYNKSIQEVLYKRNKIGVNRLNILNITDRDVKKVLESLYNNNELITLENVANRLGCSINSLYNYEFTDIILKARKKQDRINKEILENRLIDMVRKYIDYCMLSGQAILKKDIYTHIKKDKDNVNNNYPKLKEFINKEVAKIIKEQMDNERESEKELLLFAIKELYINNQTINYSSISAILGKSSKWIPNNPYLRKCVDEIVSTLE